MIATKNAEIWHSLNYSLPFIFIKFYDILINILICNWLSCFSSKYWSKISSCIFSEFLYLHNCRWFWKVLAPCTDPCGPNWSDEAARTAADDDLIIETSNTSIALYKHFLLVVINYFRQGNFYEYKISVNGCEALINFLNALSVTVSLVFSWLEFR